MFGLKGIQVNTLMFNNLSNQDYNVVGKNFLMMSEQCHISDLLRWINYNVLHPYNKTSCCLTLTRCENTLVGPQSDQGVVSLTFQELSTNYLEMCVLHKKYLWWEVQAETLYLCPKPCFGHTYKFSDCNSDHKCDFWCCVFSREYFREPAKRKWNSPQALWECLGFWRRCLTNLVITDLTKLVC